MGVRHAVFVLVYNISMVQNEKKKTKNFHIFRFFQIKSFLYEHLKKFKKTLKKFQVFFISNTFDIILEYAKVYTFWLMYEFSSFVV